MSIATVAAQQSSVTPASSATTSAATTSASGASSTNALTSLSNNFQDFLQMLMTQLQNQDPTSPMDTNQFTSELVQFSSVEQQITTNGSLTQLIQLTQGDTVIQSSALLGKPVTVQSSQLPLQNGSGTIDFNATAGQKIGVSITDSTGAVVKTAVLTAAQGANNWTWDGTNLSGAKLPDGSYGVNVGTVDATGAATPLAFGVVGTTTGVQVQNNVVQLQMGGVSVPFSSVQSVGGATGTADTSLN